MSFVQTKDGVEIFYKDWGKGQPIVFSHGCPLSTDDWTRRCSSSSITAIASSRTIGAGTDTRRRSRMATTWINPRRQFFHLGFVERTLRG